MSYKKIVFWLIVVMLLFSLSIGVTAAEKEVIRLTVGAGHPPVGLVYANVADTFFLPEVAKRVEEETNYKIQWNKAYAGAIASLAEVLESTEAGLLDIGLISIPFEPTKLYIHAMTYTIPFGTPDPVQAIRVMRKLIDENPFFEETFNKYNQKLLGIAATGNLQIITTKGLKTIDDLKGRKIAAAGPNLPWLEGTGAVAVQSDLTEAYTSFETGVYEGWIMFPFGTYGFKLFEVAPYQVNLNFGALIDGWVTINLDTWNRLPEEVQKIMVEVGREYDKVAGETSRRFEKESLEKMVAAGFTIIELPREEIVKYAELLPNIPNISAKEADSRGLPGSEIYARYLELLEEDGFDFYRKWTIE